jgi:tripartite-type tricarboxylate transporter receptor subunit TctC
VKESGVAGYEVTGWNALFAPKGTPPAIAPPWKCWATRCATSWPQADLRKRLLRAGRRAQGQHAAEMAAVFERDRRKWQQVIKQANIKI